jgi:hypothetical protein
MIKFEFKRINQELTSHYHPLAPMAGGSVNGTARFDSSADGTTWSDQTLPLPFDPAATSSWTGSIA